LITLAIVLVSMFVTYNACFAIYRRIPVLSQPWRVKVMPSGEKVRVVLAKRFCSGSYNCNSIIVATIETDSPEFDEALAMGIVSAEAKLAQMKSTRKSLRRTNKLLR